MKILEEFWYGNIEPTDYDTSSCKEYEGVKYDTLNAADTVSFSND